MTLRRRIGVVGYGKLGQYLVEAVLARPDTLELAFVWNRSAERIPSGLPVLSDLAAAATCRPDLIIEVAHPDITVVYGELFLAIGDYVVGSPTAFADVAVETRLRAAATAGPHGLYIPSGALWGAQDIQKMADRGSLVAARVTMRKHPASFKLSGELAKRNEAAVQGAETVLFDGPVRELCPLAPNNVNTMACCALAAHTLGFDGVRGCLVADDRLDAHVVDVEVTGAGGFTVTARRHNPAAVGAVTGNATYEAFLSSLMRARGLGAGLHFC